jgi:hypothetical protein
MEKQLNHLLANKNPDQDEIRKILLSIFGFYLPPGDK